MIQLDKKQKIFILCPANHATGGPEALHQLGNMLCNLGFNAFMYYINYNKNKHKSPVHPEYERYEMPFVFEVENREGNYIVFPETCCEFIWNRKYSRLQKIIWWLSVDFYRVTLEHQLGDRWLRIKEKLGLFKTPTIERIKQANVKHITQSFYAEDFLRKNGIKSEGIVSDYLKDTFLKNENIRHLKEDIVIYNVVKNRGFLEVMIAEYPEINWVPIEKMTNAEVIETMKRAKVYIDFGTHPGKERMPRESCLLDNCLIIGKDGSAKFKEDMPIKDEYHFEKNREYFPQIIAKIKDCLDNYDQRINDFKDYKTELLQGIDAYKKEVANVFELS